MATSNITLDIYPADRGEYNETATLENVNRLSRNSRPEAAMFDMFQYDPGPYRIADGTRWAATGTNALANSLALSATSLGSNVLNVAAADQGKLVNVNVGDPVVILSDQATTGPFETAAEITGSTAVWKRNYYTGAVIVAKTATTITVSRPIPTAITTTGSVTYYWTDYAHPTPNGFRARFYAIASPTRRRYQHYMGELRCSANQLTAGTVVSGGAAIAGATNDFFTLPILPGLDETANAVFNVTLNASLATVAFPPVACRQGQIHVARTHIRSKGIAPAGLDFWVEDGSGNRVSQVMKSVGYAGIETINVPFFVMTAGNYLLKMQQNSATDASCWVALVEIRQIAPDAFDALIPPTGPVFVAGDSNIQQPGNAGTIGAVFGNNLLGAQRSEIYGVGGRTQSQQTEDTILQFATNNTRYALAVSGESANSANAIRNNAGDNLGPLATLPNTVQRYAGHIMYARSILSARADLVLFLGQSRLGELADTTLVAAVYAARTSRAQRDALSATP